MRRLLNKYFATLLVLLFSYTSTATAGAVDSTSVPNSSVTEAASFSGTGGDNIAVGTIMLWATNTPPSGWIIMQGQSTNSYPQLKNVIGSTVPDMRGYFVRGYGGNSGALKAAQTDAMRNITGTVTYLAETFSYNASTTGVFTKSNCCKSGNTPSKADASNSGRLTFDASRQVPTAAEFRPINRALNYIIKYQ